MTNNYPLQKGRFENTTKEWLIKEATLPNTIKVTTSLGILDFQVEQAPCTSQNLTYRKVGSKSLVIRGRLEGSTIPMALKITTELQNDQEILKKRLDLVTRLSKANRLFELPQYIGVADLDLRHKDLPTKWSASVMRWIDGQTLAEWFETESDQIRPIDLSTIFRTLLGAVFYLKDAKVRHDDLHTHNIIITTQKIELFRQGDSESLDLIIVDTDSLKSTEDTTSKVHDDYSIVIQIMIESYNRLMLSRRLTTQYPAYTRKLREFITFLCDADPARVLPLGKADLMHHFSELDDMAHGWYRPPTIAFQPFDAISAEHLANDEVLRDLFEDSLPWFSTLKEDNPCVLTGPRGCGKSMAFRYLSVRTHINSPTNGKLEELPFMGIYISCATDLQNNLLWVARNKELVEKFSPYIVTYFQCVLLRELFRTLAQICTKPALSQLYQLRESAINAAISLASDKITFPPAFQDSGLPGRLHSVATRFEQLRHHLANYLQTEDGPPSTIPTLAPSYAADIGVALWEKSNQLGGRKICYLLDDYTDYRIKTNVQRVLNKVIFERRESQIFKISAERYGFIPDDIDGVGHDDTREFATLDAGHHFLAQRGRNSAKPFTEQLLNRRLSVAKWSGNIASLLGSSKYQSDRELALALRKGEKYCYHGLDTISRLLSGDIATLIHVVREIFRLGQVGPQTTEMISHQIQDTAVCNVSRSLLERIQSYTPHGSELHNIATKFGDLVRRIQKEAPLVSVSGKEHKEPSRKLQIELSMENPATLFAQLSSNPQTEKAADLLRHLVRRGIFIHREDSGSKRGEGKRTARLHFRRILLPTFKVALVRHGYFDLNSLEEFVTMLIEIDKFVESEWMKSNPPPKFNKMEQLTLIK